MKELKEWNNTKNDWSSANVCEEKVAQEDYETSMKNDGTSENVRDEQIAQKEYETSMENDETYMTKDSIKNDGKSENVRDKKLRRRSMRHPGKMMRLPWLRVPWKKMGHPHKKCGEKMGNGRPNWSNPVT